MLCCGGRRPCHRAVPPAPVMPVEGSLSGKSSLMGKATIQLLAVSAAPVVPGGPNLQQNFFRLPILAGRGTMKQDELMHPETEHQRVSCARQTSNLAGHLRAKAEPVCQPPPSATHQQRSAESPSSASLGDPPVPDRPFLRHLRRAPASGLESHQPRGASGFDPQSNATFPPCLPAGQSSTTT